MVSDSLVQSPGTAYRLIYLQHHTTDADALTVAHECTFLVHIWTRGSLGRCEEFHFRLDLLCQCVCSVLFDSQEHVACDNVITDGRLRIFTKVFGNKKLVPRPPSGAKLNCMATCLTFSMHAISAYHGQPPEYRRTPGNGIISPLFALCLRVARHFNSKKTSVQSKLVKDRIAAA